ncbi:hypothetical protein Tco_1466255 [Tanacetum coccineum]
MATLGRLLFWAGHERFVNDDGVLFKKNLLVSFDLIAHLFQVHDIDAIFRDGLTVPICISSLGNSLIVTGSTNETVCYLFCGWSLLVDVASVTSFTLLFVISTLNYVKLLGFTNDEISLPIVEVPGPHQLANSHSFCKLAKVAGTLSLHVKLNSMSSPSSPKFKVILVYEEIKCGVLLPKNISQKNFVRYVRKKFNVEDNKELLLSYNIGSNSFNIIDEDDVDFFLKAVLESGDVVMSVFIKSTEKTVEVTPSKPLDIDLNIPLFHEPVTHEWMKNSLNYLPPTPHAPILDLKSITTSHHGCGRMCPPRLLLDIFTRRIKKENGVYRPKDIINDLNIEFNIDFSYKRAWKGKQLALKSNQRDPISSLPQMPIIVILNGRY